jgi:hypothetical protein
VAPQLQTSARVALSSPAPAEVCGFLHTPARFRRRAPVPEKDFFSGFIIQTVGAA